MSIRNNRFTVRLCVCPSLCLSFSLSLSLLLEERSIDVKTIGRVRVTASATRYGYARTHIRPSLPPSLSMSFGRWRVLTAGIAGKAIPGRDIRSRGSHTRARSAMRTRSPLTTVRMEFDRPHSTPSVRPLCHPHPLMLVADAYSIYSWSLNTHTHTRAHTHAQHTYR